jgi:hypothetical protein
LQKTVVFHFCLSYAYCDIYVAYLINFWFHYCNNGKLLASDYMCKILFSFLSVPYLLWMQVCFPQHSTPGTSTRIPKHNRHQSGNDKNIFKLIGGVLKFASLTSNCGFCKKAVLCFYSSNVYLMGLQLSYCGCHDFSIRLSLWRH